ncbi:MAG: DNA translocase FtsK 4TM domain-containing protein, partial [Paracoccaceae bacterium]|nr:DNA translocase FtsK 4TM domain-containing protein [Paracoccaceae bacterium]
MAYQTRRDPLLDANIQEAIEKRGRELLGIVLIGIGIMAASMLASFSPEDPSWMSASDAPVNNWMGSIGAAVAAPFNMIIGGASWGIAAGLIVWGLLFALHYG